MSSWLRSHGRAMGSALARLARSPLSMLFNVVVVGIALALPVTLYTLVHDIEGWAGRLPGEPEITVFMARDAAHTEIAEVGQRLKADAAVAKVQYVPRDQALEAMKRDMGLADVLQGLDHNPLPDAYVVTARDRSAPALERLRDELAKWPKVETVQLDSLWAKRLDALLATVRMAALGLSLLLAFAVVAVTFNTIRLQILTRRADIEVARLFGATDAYIRRPFLYDGALLGVLGGLAACGFVGAIVFLLNRGLAPVSQLYGVALVMQTAPWTDVAAVVGFALALGWLGAWLSVARHLAFGVTH
jgi:cell division transport system permease protein